MADFNKPTVDSEYTQFPTEIRAAISAALSFLDGEHTNIPLKAKRWNTSSKIFEEYNGTQWVPMATEYKLPVDYNSLKNKPTPNSAVNDESDTKFASSAAVKTAYDKGVEAKTAADNAQRSANDGINRANNAQSTADAKQSPATTLAGYGIGNFKIEPFVGNLNTLKTDGVYAITQASRSQNLPVSTSCHIQVIAGGDGAWCRQLAYVAYSTDVYERHQTSYQTDSWSAWVKLNDIEPVRQLVAQKANLADFSYQKIGDFEVRKYPDGTMIQTRCIVQNDIHSAEYKYFNWAQAFVATPLIFSKVTTSVNTGHDCDVNVLTKSNNTTCYYYEYEHGLLDQGAIRVEFLAIGRWKQ